MHEPNQVAPLVAVFNWRTGALAVETPDLVQNRFEASRANAMLIGGPEFDLRLRISGRHHAQQRSQLF